MKLDAALVMPIYNEQDCIRAVVQAWLDVLSALDIRFTLLLLEGSSPDNTAAELKAFAGNPRVQIVTLPKCGHGSTLMIGYRMAVEQADWVFQCDSDNEIPADQFPQLWQQRIGVDAVFGARVGRAQTVGRKLLSFCNWLTARMLFGRGVRDVNSPYRLMRSACLGQIIGQMPADLVAPNVIISGAFVRARGRFRHVPVSHHGRNTGHRSLSWRQLFAWTFKAFWQTVRWRPRLTE